MLVISRRRGETLFVGDHSVKIVEIRGDQVRLGITAPRNVPVDREEVRISKIAYGPRTKSPIAEAVEEIGHAIGIIEHEAANTTE